MAVAQKARLMWVKEPWGEWWRDPHRQYEAQKLGEKWAQEALEKLTREIRGGEATA